MDNELNEAPLHDDAKIIGKTTIEGSYSSICEHNRGSFMPLKLSYGTVKCLTPLAIEIDEAEIIEEADLVVPDYLRKRKVIATFDNADITQNISILDAEGNWIDSSIRFKEPIRHEVTVEGCLDIRERVILIRFQDSMNYLVLGGLNQYVGDRFSNDWLNETGELFEDSDAAYGKYVLKEAPALNRTLLSLHSESLPDEIVNNLSDSKWNLTYCYRDVSKKTSYTYDKISDSVFSTRDLDPGEEGNYPEEHFISADQAAKAFILTYQDSDIYNEAFGSICKVDGEDKWYFTKGYLLPTDKQLQLYRSYTQVVEEKISDLKSDSNFYALIYTKHIGIETDSKTYYSSSDGILFYEEGSLGGD